MSEHESAFAAVVVYQTRDGKRHNTERAAAEWAQWIDDVEAGNELFAKGSTLLEALLRAYQQYSWSDFDKEAEALSRLTKDTALKISHWQCSDKPVYLAERLLDNGKVRVGGVGGWSGYYANDVSPSDLARYAADTFSRI